MKALNTVFQQLRKDGFDARQNYKCCSGCASNAIANEYREKLKANPRFERKGFVFFHKQDGDLDNRFQFSDKPKYVMIRYSSVEVSDDAGKLIKEIGLPTKEIGQLVVKKLRAEGLKTSWNGNPDIAIKVFIPEESLS